MKTTILSLLCAIAFQAMIWAVDASSNTNTTESALGAKAPSGKVMVINSNPGIEKYNIVYEEFQESLQFPVIDVDLSQSWMNKTRLQDRIVKEHPDAIFCIGSQAYLMANEIYPDGNLVFSMAINWERFDIGNKTRGISLELNPQQELYIFKYLFPEITSIGVIYSEKFNKERIQKSVEAAQEMGITLHAIKIKPGQRPAELLKPRLGTFQAYWIIHDPLALSNKSDIMSMFSMLNKHKVPVFAYNKAFSKLGAVLVISPDLHTIGRQSAQFTEDMVMQSKSKQSTPVVDVSDRVQKPAGSHLSVNMAKVRAYELPFNEDGLQIVNEIIDE